MDDRLLLHLYHRLVDPVDHLQGIANPEAQAHHIGSNHPHETSFRSGAPRPSRREKRWGIRLR